MPSKRAAPFSVGRQVGDEVAAADPAPTEAQNYFAMLRERPPALLARLCAQWGTADGTAARVAALLGCDLVSACFALPLLFSHFHSHAAQVWSCSPVVVNAEAGMLQQEAADKVWGGLAQ
jgi:hypothetical protein